MDWAERKQGEELAPVSKTALYNRVPNYILLLVFFIAVHFSAERLLCAAQISTWVELSQIAHFCIFLKVIVF